MLVCRTYCNIVVQKRVWGSALGGKTGATWLNKNTGAISHPAVWLSWQQGFYTVWGGYRPCLILLYLRKAHLQVVEPQVNLLHRRQLTAATAAAAALDHWSTYYNSVSEGFTPKRIHDEPDAPESRPGTASSWFGGDTSSDTERVEYR